VQLAIISTKNIARNTSSSNIVMFELISFDKPI